MRQVEMVATAALIPYAKNSRTHDEAQVGQIAGSIREFGFTNPVLIDDANGIVAGHCRVLAAIACEKTGRHARLMEIDPKYADVIVRRWQEFTGKQARNEATGATFSEVAASTAAAVAEAA